MELPALIGDVVQVQVHAVLEAETAISIMTVKAIWPVAKATVRTITPPPVRTGIVLLIAAFVSTFM